MNHDIGDERPGGAGEVELRSGIRVVQAERGRVHDDIDTRSDLDGRRPGPYRRDGGRSIGDEAGQRPGPGRVTVHDLDRPGAGEGKLHRDRTRRPARAEQADTEAVRVHHGRE
jgi:hypothetical protein